MFAETNGQVTLANAPMTLQELSQWVLWRVIERDGKPTKLPFQTNGRAAKSNDPATWTTFAEACERYIRGGFAGVGFVFSADDEICGIDLDGCRDPETGKVAEWAREIILKFDSYAEVSPSKTGVKIFCRGRWPNPTGTNVRLREPATSSKSPGVEAYDHGRYFAVTGWHCAGPLEPQLRQDALNWLKEKIAPKDSKAARPSYRTEDPHPAIESARKYLAQLPPAISGHGGHNATFHAACVLVLGFNLGEQEALDLLRGYNARCEPPWSEKELLHKVQDAAKQPGERGYLLRGRRILSTGQQIDGAPNVTTELPDGKAIILTHFREHYDPTFRRGTSIYSSELGREVRRADALAGPSSILIELLAGAKDAPKNDDGVKRSSLPWFFKTWAPTAWADLCDSLPDEEATDEVSEPAREQFRQKVTAAFAALVNLGYQHHRQGQGDAIDVERRTIADWANLFAKPGRWKSVRGYRLWCRRGEDGRLRIAFRADLFSQIPGGSDLASIGHRKLASLAELYDVGQRCKVQGGEARAIELANNFVDDLFAEPLGPGTDEPGQTDTAPRARVREEKCVLTGGQSGDLS